MEGNMNNQGAQKLSVEDLMSSLNNVYLGGSGNNNNVIINSNL